MPCEITIESQGRPPERATVAVAVSAGGSRADGIVLPGVAAGALRLSPAASGLVVEACAAGVRAAGHPLPPGARRLVRTGERVELQGAALAVRSVPAAGGATRVAAVALLRDAIAGDDPIAGPHLVVLTGPSAGERHALGAEQTLGRGRAATLRLADPQASRVHARVCVGPGGVTIEDLRSKNGVRVDGVRIDRRPRPLAAGAEVTIGETVLALVDPLPPAAAREAPAAVPGQPRPSSRRARRRLPLPLRGPLAAAALLALSAAALALAAS